MKPEWLSPVNDPFIFNNTIAMNTFFDFQSLLAQINDTEVNAVGAAFRLLLSTLLGAMVGLERRHKGQIAGMRTFSLICMGATLAMLVSIYIPQEYLGLKNGDPGRIAAQVISGIGFLGAGAIIQMKGSVRGLTTAAGVWVIAAIGLAVGAGMYWIAIIASLLIIIVLTLLELSEKHLFKGYDQKIVRLKVGYIVEDIAPFRTFFDNYRIHISDEYFFYDYEQRTTTINFMVRSREKTNFIRLFSEIQTVGEVLSLTLTKEMDN